MGTGLCVSPGRKEEEDGETSTGWRGGGLKPAVGTPSCGHEPFGKATALKIGPFKHGLLVQLDEGGVWSHTQVLASSEARRDKRKWQGSSGWSWAQLWILANLWGQAVDSFN